MATCPFKDVLGVPGEGVHALRFAGFSVNDILLTIIGAVLTKYLFHIDFWTGLFLWFVLGELLHYGFGVNTAFLKMIGLSPKCDAP